MNITKAPFTRGSYKVETLPLWQYDYGQILQITGLELPANYEVHFANDPNGAATTVLGNEDGVAIPDIYLTKGDVYAWLFLHTGEDDGETVYQVHIPVRKRASISDQPPTPVQQSIIEQAITALNDGVEAVEKAVQDIDQTIDTALQEAKDSGEFDGKDGEDGAPGRDGVDGVSPTASVSKSGKVTTLTVTDGSGTTTSEIRDGEDGDPTTLIDDTAGEGDTSKVWSADKSADVETEIKNAIDLLDDVKDEIASVVIGSNLFDNDFDESGYIDDGNGDKPGANYVRTSKYYQISDTHETLYSYNQDSGGTTNLLFYTAQKVFISRVNIQAESTSKSIPEGAAYFRVYRNATKTQPITLTYEYKGQYEPYGLVVTLKNGIVHYATLDATLQGKIDDITTATETATAAQEAVAEMLVQKATANLFDSDFDESGYIDDENGDKDSANYVRTSKYYQVDDSKGTIYSYNPDNGNTTNLLFYNAQKVFLKRENIAAESTSKSIPEGAAYFRLYRNYYKTQPITITYEYAGHTIPYKRWTEIKEDMVGYESVNLEGKRMLGSVLAGRKILVFGDSIIGNDRVEGVCDFLAEYSGATIYNGAIGGTRITDLRSSQYDSPNYVYFDGVKLVHALMTDTWTDQDAHISDVSSYVGEETLPMLKALDCSKLDVVVIAYGRNDVTSSETTANIEAALATIVDDIQNHYPNIRILVLTPIWGMFSSGTVDGDDYVNSNTNMTLRILADTFTSKAKALHVSSHDMLENMQLSQNMMDTYMDNDHVHLNSAGNAMYAHIVYGKLRSMF